MSDETQQPNAETEVVRKLVVPNAEAETDDGPRSPKNTDRDFKAESDTKTDEEPEVVRKPVVIEAEEDEP